MKLMNKAVVEVMLRSSRVSLRFNDGLKGVATLCALLIKVMEKIITDSNSNSNELCEVILINLLHPRTLIYEPLTLRMGSIADASK